ncbi:MAG TPA: NDP-sugar synthase [Candidatus Nitrosotenuis sp.]|jgi:NDP-sugar pyrophosphorylase family protein|nr:NDP-sugar synthase [Candidatus Nitrosotenuis sp.]
MKAVILAAGLGRRLRPLSERVPKPLFPVAGRPLIQRALDRVRPWARDGVCINLYHGAQAVADYLRAQPSLVLAREPEILGTGGGIAQFAPQLSGSQPFLVHNCDLVCDIDLGALLEQHLRRRPAATLALVDFPPENTVACDRGRVVALGEAPPGTLRLCYCGVGVFTPGVLSHLPARGSLAQGLRSLLAAGERIEAWLVPAGTLWRNINTFQDYLEVHRCLHPGVRDDGARVHPSARLEGFVYLGESALVEEGARLRDCVVWPGARVPAGALLERAVVTPWTVHALA